MISCFVIMSLVPLCVLHSYVYLFGIVSTLHSLQLKTRVCAQLCQEIEYVAAKLRMFALFQYGLFVHDLCCENQRGGLVCGSLSGLLLCSLHSLTIKWIAASMQKTIRPIDLGSSFGKIEQSLRGRCSLNTVIQVGAIQFFAKNLSLYCLYN